jgi:hypothetical protein
LGRYDLSQKKIRPVWEKYVYFFTLVIQLSGIKVSPDLISVEASHNLFLPALADIIIIIFRELGDNLLLYFLKIGQLILQNLEKVLGVVDGFHITKSGLFQDLTIVLHSVQVVTSLLDVALELGRQFLVALTIISDQELATWNNKCNKSILYCKFRNQQTNWVYESF